ncbi:putative glucose-6-phosphate isomerase [Cucumispora dikerogammari]|nr:putative glucose-6-phosphate isomerase [Cucumispora dikerogammari]
MKQTFQLSVNDENILFDYSHTHYSIEQLLLDNSGRQELIAEKLNSLFSGLNINYTEQRKVLHWLLRKPNILNKLCKFFKIDAIKTMKDDVVECPEEEEIYNEYVSMGNFVNSFKEGKLMGLTDKKLTSVVNIGIGGSDLGPKAICKAFDFMSDTKTYFVSNVDPTNMIDVLSKIDVETTLFVVVSKSFTTRETMENARMARDYLQEMFPKLDVSKNFVAVSANTETAKDFGVSKTFAMFDYIGGRFSLWSTAGLIIGLKLGFDHFLRLLNGASLIDTHVKENITNLNKSLPYIQSLLELEYMRDGYSKNVVGYSNYLALYYKFIQQLEMESNGKRKSTMIIWGGVGTDVQHSYFQMLHQGDKKVLTEFIVPMKYPKSFFSNKRFNKNIKESNVLKEKFIENHKLMVANCIAQSASLFDGKYNEDINKTFPGGRPSFYVALSTFTPEILGALISFNEHKVAIQGFLLDINSFDQYGVELGKTVAKHVEDGLDKVGEIVENLCLEVKDFYEDHK